MKHFITAVTSFTGLLRIYFFGTDFRCYFEACYVCKTDYRVFVIESHDYTRIISYFSYFDSLKRFFMFSALHSAVYAIFRAIKITKLKKSYNGLQYNKMSIIMLCLMLNVIYTAL